MKTITLAVEGFAESDKDTNEAIALEISGKTGSAGTAAQVLVDQLRAAGVRIQTASLTFAPRPGSHERAEVIDLTEEPTPEAEQQLSPAEDHGSTESRPTNV